ncbi:unnamed protein product [Closterium sp. Naga37s-1]|nr:unnamed protein product [Closterium sp. Naga37s-1]
MLSRDGGKERGRGGGWAGGGDGRGGGDGDGRTQRGSPRAIGRCATDETTAPFVASSPWFTLLLAAEGDHRLLLSCKGECATVAAETIKELKTTVEMLVQQLKQVNARLAAAEKRNVLSADEKNGAKFKGSMVEAAAANKEKDVPKSDTRDQQKHKGMVQLKGAAKKEKSLVLNVGGYAADEAKEIGEPKVKPGLKEAEIAGEQMSAFPKTGVGISYAAALVKGKRKELVQEGKQ